MAPLREVARSRLLWVAGQFALVGALVVVYFGVRGLTAGSPALARAHARDVVELERTLGIDVENALQTPFLEVPFATTVANWVYIWGHWPVIVVTMLWLAWRHRDAFRRLRDAMIISGGVGMVIFAAYPLAPPRLAGLDLVDTVSDQSSAYRVLQPPAFVNQYAAMPSLHSGWDLLVGIAIVSVASTVALRAVGFAMPALMAVAVVATANHYVVDVVAGVSLVLLAHGCALLLERRRAAHAPPLVATAADPCPSRAASEVCSRR